jgi:hypothetical protein
MPDEDYDAAQGLHLNGVQVREKMGGDVRPV